MKFILSATRFITYTNFWVALGAAMMTLSSYSILNIAPNYFMVIFNFSATLFTYNFHRLFKLKTGLPTQGERIDWLKLNISFSEWAMYIGAAICLFLSFGFQWKTIAIIVGICICSFFYIVPVRFDKGKNLRDIPFIKSYIIALVWATTSVLIPTIESGIPFDLRVIELFVSYFLFILALCIPFDIRDLQLDEPAKKTTPQLLGVKGAKITSFALVSLSVFFIVDDITQVILLASSVMIYMILLILMTKKRDELFFSFLIDGMLVLHPLIILLGNKYCQSM